MAWGINYAQQNALWAKLTDAQKLAALGLMEPNSGPNIVKEGKNVIAAAVNHAGSRGVPVGADVSKLQYQPMGEPAQMARLPSLLKRPEFGELSKFAEDYMGGKVKSPVGNATNYLALEPEMRALAAQDPSKYSSWKGWTGYNQGGGHYQNVTARDSSHAFLVPVGEKGYEVPYTGDSTAPAQDTQTASADIPPILHSSDRQAQGAPPPAPTEDVASSESSPDPVQGAQPSDGKGAFDFSKLAGSLGDAAQQAFSAPKDDGSLMRSAMADQRDREAASKIALQDPTAQLWAQIQQRRAFA